MSTPTAPDNGAAPHAKPPPSDPSRMALPHAAADALALPRDALFLELHCISFSHYCARAKWYLGACGMRVDALVNMLPVHHVPAMISLLKRFKAPRCKPTASSNSPAATPALAAYQNTTTNADGTVTKTPLFLLQDSELIGRWAALRAQALGDGGAAVRTLYGPGAKLSVVVEQQEVEKVGPDGTKVKNTVHVPMAVLEYDDAKTAASAQPTPAELERRLSGALGVESRRLAYFHLLPSRGLLMRMCAANIPESSGFLAKRVAAPLWALVASLALPKLLGVNAPAVDKGLKKLDAEFDYLDALIQERGCLVAASKGGEEAERVGAFLCGGGNSGPSAADVSLATLASPLVGDFAGYGAHLPLESELPEAFRSVLRERYMDRPAARYARALWREHGAAAVAAATAATGAAGPASRL